MNKINNKYNYIWDYLIPENNDRTKTLEKIVSPYLKQNETAIDMVCGFSPMTGFMTSKYNNFVIGFDNNKKSIKYCQQKYNKKLTKFYVDSDDTFETNKKIDVHIHIGVSPSTNILEPKDDAGASLKIIMQNQPRLIIIESAIEHAPGLDKLKQNIVNTNIYQLVKTAKYKIKFNQESVNPAFNTALNRQVLIFEKIKNKTITSINEDTIAKLLSKCNPSSQAEDLSNLNLGFGYLYYSLSRILKPQTIIVLGSGRGFSPVCFALAVKDNHNDGKVYFVDAGYSNEKDGKDKGMGGDGFWHHKNKVKKIWSDFDVSGIIETHITTTAKFLNFFNKKIKKTADVIYIDADHSYNGFKSDFENYSKLLSDNGLIIFHDALVDDGTYNFHFGIKKYYESKLINNKKYSVFRLPVWPGLGFAQKRKPSTIINFVKNIFKSR